MSPALERRLRSALTTIAVLLSLTVAGALAWATQRYERRGVPKPTACSAITDAVFATASTTTPDSILLSQLLGHRQQCIGDATYVDQARRLMLNVQKPDDARALLVDAERSRAMSADELKAQGAWIDLTAAHIAWTNGEEARSDELGARARATANALREKWPEWTVPYTILTEAQRSSSKPSAADTTDYFKREDAARGRKINGAFVRRMSDWQPVVYVFVISVIGMLGLCAGVSGLLDIREMTKTPTSPIASATSGYVELKGTLFATSDDSVIAGPQSKTRVLWYEISRRSSMKGSRTKYERSATAFMLRDSTGVAIIDPKDMTVYTRHLVATFGERLGASGHVSEKSLREGDSVYALGQLTTTTLSDGRSEKHLRVADNGRRLLVSNLSEERLVLISRAWLWVGAASFAAALIVLAWSAHQRYDVVNVPGMLAR